VIQDAAPMPDTSEIEWVTVIPTGIMSSSFAKNLTKVGLRARV
jgi:hypothetical protein